MQVNFLSFAVALFEVAENKTKQDLYYHYVQQLDQLNLDNSDLAKVLSLPTVNKDERKQLIQEVLKELDYEEIFIYWVWTIIDNNQYHNFHQIRRYCTHVYHAINHIIRVEVTSATELSRNQLEKITDFFSNRLKAQVDLKLTIKPNLIAGLKIQLNNKTYNNTFKYKLEELKKVLLSKKG